jgi:hypothetical protein
MLTSATENRSTFVILVGPLMPVKDESYCIAPLVRGLGAAIAGVFFFQLAASDVANSCAVAPEKTVNSA